MFLDRAEITAFLSNLTTTDRHLSQNHNSASTRRIWFEVCKVCKELPEPQSQEIIILAVTSGDQPRHYYRKGNMAVSRGIRKRSSSCRIPYHSTERPSTG